MHLDHIEHYGACAVPVRKKRTVLGVGDLFVVPLPFYLVVYTKIMYEILHSDDYNIGVWACFARQ